MKIIFEKEYLEELYTTGKATSKKYRFQPEVIRKYIETVDKLRAANRIEDLFIIGFTLRKLIGDKKGLESVRITLQYVWNLYHPFRNRKYYHLFVSRH